MLHRLRMMNPAVVAAALMLSFAMAGPRDAFAYLIIDWGSCRPEWAWDSREKVWQRTGREICDLMDFPGIIFRPEPPEPKPDRICTAKTKKAKKALQDARTRLNNQECASAVNGPVYSGMHTIDNVIEHEQYDACATNPGQANDAAKTAAGLGPLTDMQFFPLFFGNLGGFDFMNQLKNDDLRRQLIVLSQVAVGTGKLNSSDSGSAAAVNQDILAKCFTANEKKAQTFEAGSVDANGVGSYPDATSASNDANDGVLGDDGSGAPPTEDVFTADPYGSTIPPDDGGGGGGGDIQPLYVY